PHKIDFGNVEREEFQPFQPSPVQRVKTAIHVDDIDLLRTLTVPSPSRQISELASRSCGFPGRRPKTTVLTNDWPPPMEKPNVVLPEAYFRWKVGDRIRRAIVQVAYRWEMEAAFQSIAELERLRGTLQDLEGL